MKKYEIIEELDQLAWEYPNLYERDWVKFEGPDGRYFGSLVYYTRRDIYNSLKNENKVASLKPKNEEYKEMTIETKGVSSVGNNAEIHLDCNLERPYKTPIGTGYSEVKVKINAFATGVVDLDDKEVFICQVTGKPFVIYQERGNAYCFSVLSFRKPHFVTNDDINFHNQMQRRTVVCRAK